MGPMLGYAWPVLVWLGTTAAAAGCVRRSRLALAGITAAALLMLAEWQLMRQHAVNIFAVSAPEMTCHTPPPSLPLAGTRSLAFAQAART
jgi:hypothetical protein